MNFFEIMNRFPTDPRYPEDSQFDIIIKDTSANLIASPGDLIRCVALETPIVKIKDNDLVVLDQSDEKSDRILLRRVRIMGSHCELYLETNDSTSDERPIVINKEKIPEKIKAKVIWIYRNPFTPDEILESLNECLNKISSLENQLFGRKASKETFKYLTRREIEVLDLIAQGYLNKIIAHKLKLSQRTVENHRRSIMKKTKARSIAHLLNIYFGNLNRTPE